MARSTKTSPAKATDIPTPDPQDNAAVADLPEKATAEAQQEVPLVEEPVVPDAARGSVAAAPPPSSGAAQAEPRVTVRRVGFLPVALGGVVAAGLGFAAGWQGLVPRPGGQETEAALAALDTRIDAVAADLAGLPVAPDVTPLEAGIAELSAAIVPLAERLEALERQVAALERAPAGDGSLSAAAIAAWQRDIEDLKAAMAAQEAEMARMVSEAAERLEAAESTVAGIEEQAMETATATLRRAVLANLQASLDGGQPFASLLGELERSGVAVPGALASVAGTGVATLAGLAETFPDAARAALAAARAEGLADDGGTGVLAFLRSQLDVRSTAPREGDDPDAVLSRAEAALREARLTDALAEIAALPEVVRAPMGDWIAAAETRVAALSALQALTEALPAPDTSN